MKIWYPGNYPRIFLFNKNSFLGYNRLAGKKMNPKS